MKKVSVQCRNVRLAYGPTRVLEDVSLDIAPGEFFALLGPSGSGKSTLLRLIAGFAQAQGGQVLVDGVDITAMPPWQRNIGMVFQSYALWPHLSVWDNVAFGLVERRMDRATIARKVTAALDLVGLAALGERRPNQLSGGQQQRVALARTVVIEPQLLLLDEPLSNLDKTLRVQMRQELLAMQRRLGLTTIFVTHDQEEAMTTADRMAVLDHGVVQQVGTPTALYDDPANAFVAGFVGTMNLLPATLRARDSQALSLAIDGVGELRLPISTAAMRPASLAHEPGQGGRLLLSFRPHTVQLEPDGAVAAHSLAGTVAGHEFLGEFVRYKVTVGHHALAVDLPHRAGVAPLATGRAVALTPDASQWRLLPA